MNKYKIFVENDFKIPDDFTNTFVLIDLIKGLAEENKKQQQKINQAIELLEPMKHCELFLGGRQSGKSNYQKLLKILKGDINE